MMTRTWIQSKLDDPGCYDRKGLDSDLDNISAVASVEAAFARVIIYTENTKYQLKEKYV